VEKKWVPLKEGDVIRVGDKTIRLPATRSEPASGGLRQTRRASAEQDFFANDWNRHKDGSEPTPSALKHPGGKENNPLRAIANDPPDGPGSSWRSAEPAPRA
jgi:hypothetical protein